MKALRRLVEHLERCEVLTAVTTSYEHAPVIEQGRRMAGSPCGKIAGFLHGVVRGIKKLDTRKAASTIRHSPCHQHLPRRKRRRRVRCSSGSQRRYLLNGVCWLRRRRTHVDEQCQRRDGADPRNRD